MTKPASTRVTTRRQFLGTTLTAVAAPYVIPGSALGQNVVPSANSRLNIACIGLGGRMDSLVKEVTLGLQQNVVALCDVDPNRIAETRKAVGDPLTQATAYADYRTLLEREKTLDAVIVATPDHWHAPICKAAIHAGKHVYCEKPLTHAISEARMLRDLSRQAKVVTQTGNQGSASSNLRRCIEVIQAGLLGQVHEVHAWHPRHGWPSGVDRPTGEDPLPQGFDWDFWLGGAPMRPYKNDIYHPAKWRGWYDFGNGSIGDFCCHAFNLPVRALKLEYPTKIEVTGVGLGKESFPTSCTLRFHFPKRGNLDPVILCFYTGGDLPPEAATHDLSATFGSVPELGCLLLGEQGSISAGLWNDEGRFKLKDDKEFQSIQEHEAAKTVPQTLPRTNGHMQEWVEACKGGPVVFSNFDIGGHITEIGLAGSLALRLGHDIEWDGRRMRVKEVPESAALVRPVYREKWRREM